MVEAKFQPGAKLSDSEVSRCLELLTKVSVIHRNMDIGQGDEDLETEETLALSDEELSRELREGQKT